MDFILRMIFYLMICNVLFSDLQALTDRYANINNSTDNKFSSSYSSHTEKFSSSSHSPEKTHNDKLSSYDSKYSSLDSKSTGSAEVSTKVVSLSWSQIQKYE